MRMRTTEQAMKRILAAVLVAFVAAWVPASAQAQRIYGSGFEALCTSAAIDIAGNGLDEDCSGTADDFVATSCDAGLAVADADPVAAAHAIDLCRTSDGVSWGLLQAVYTKADGSGTPAAVAHGILDGFGPNVHVQAGARLLALSTGTARRPTDAGFASPGQGAQTSGAASPPPGYPGSYGSCPSGGAPQDASALQVVLLVPVNAHGYAFDLKSHNTDFPSFLCTQFNDEVLVLAFPPPAGTVNNNVSFTAAGIPINANHGTDVCTPTVFNGNTYPCVLGNSQLTGTGFEGFAASRWFTTRAPAIGGTTLTLRFVVWDSGDGLLDSTLLLDNFRWITDPVAQPTTTGIVAPL
jgi:hypothetical protein